MPYTVWSGKALLPAMPCTASSCTALHCTELYRAALQCTALHRCSHCVLHLKYRADSPTRPLQPCTVLCSAVQKAVGAGCSHFLVCPARLQGLLPLQCGQQGITCGRPELGPAILGLEATSLPSCWHFCDVSPSPLSPQTSPWQTSLSPLQDMVFENPHFHHDFSFSDTIF